MRKNSRTFVTLFYWLKFLGLNPLKISKGNELEFSYFGLIYGCFLNAISFYVVYIVIIERSKMAVPGDSPIGQIVDVIRIISGFLENAFTLLSFRFFQNRVKLIVESFLKAQKILVKLGSPDDSQKLLRRLGLGLLIVNCLYTSVMIFNNTAMTNYPDSHMFVWIFYYIIRLSSFNMATIFLWSFVTVKQKFRQLNDKVRFVMRNSSDDEGPRGSTGHSSRRTILISERIKTISQLHRQLRDVTDRIQEHCGGFVACNVITVLMTLTIIVHIAYLFLKTHSGPLTASEISYVFIILLCIFFPVLILTQISNVCGSLTDEANETGNILHATLNDRDNLGDTAAKFHLFSMDLLKNRVNISLLGCLNLDHFFVYSVIGSATTFLTIMLQFYN